MKQWLNTIRKPGAKSSTILQVRNSFLILLLGAALGVFSKWLDTTSISAGIWWQNVLGSIDLGNILSALPILLVIALAISIYSRTALRASLNVFLFFLGMICAYHLFTQAFTSFNPQENMTIWYSFTLASPILAFISWYAKGIRLPSLIISIFILGVMAALTFNAGFWYLYIFSPTHILLFIVAALILYVSPLHSVISIIGAAMISPYLLLFWLIFSDTLF
ncbi:hypothetical protein [Granulicatella seriolae]|uniref:Uncharacterized protein n=1 Tax=Granulicatella seriolae TaxID=2967226 RepID=A0ABT1WLT6_9LACT|nr:hypothetical protein [Granulicatella seriolae]